MRRALVLVDETARHPFRQTLPPHVCGSARALPRRPVREGWLAATREFLMAYCACFVAVSLYIA